MISKPENCTLKIGDKLPYFSLKTTEGKILSSKDLGDLNGLCVIFTCNHCPYAQAYEARIKALSEAFLNNGIKFLAISANDADSYPQDSFENMVLKKEEAKWHFPYLHDETQSTARAFDAACTPESYLFDKDLNLYYHGRIDDNHQDQSAITDHSLSDAINSLLEGLPPKQKLTPAIGCSIKWKSA